MINWKYKKNFELLATECESFTLLVKWNGDHESILKNSKKGFQGKSSNLYSIYIYTQVVDNGRIIKGFFSNIMDHYSQDSSLDDDNIQWDS